MTNNKFESYLELTREDQNSRNENTLMNFFTGGSEFHSEISFSNFLRISREIEIHAGHANLFVPK